MASSANGRRSKPFKKNKEDPRSLKRKRDVDEHEKLEKAVAELDIKAEIKDFSQLPLCQATAEGLDASHFKTLTDIQSKAIPHALKGRDILGAAKTGSGKTLAFLVPVLENLYRQKWTALDGLGALILSPTRELAIQIYEVLRKIGRKHNFSAGLVIGGKDLQDEQGRIGRMNILVSTPGRMLQHMDQTSDLDVANLQMLVLDEADRIMDMGFQASVDAILEHLPKERQTMLFSATQTKKVSDLARLSLRDPEYVAVHESASSATPATPATALCGLPTARETQHSLRVYKSKLEVENYRFSLVGEADCPEDADTYIHRVGRTARYERSGRAVLILDPSEEKGMLARLEHKKVPIQRINIAERKKQDIKSQLQNMAFQDPELKYLGQKAFVSYTTSLYVQKDKEVFDINKYDLEGFAASMGLPGAPKIKFQKGDDAKRLKNAPRAAFSSDEDTDVDNGEKKPKKEEVRTRYDRMFERRNQNVLSGHYNKMIADEEDEASDEDADEDNDFLSVKRVVPMDESSDEESTTADAGPAAKVIAGLGKEPLVIDSKRREKLLKSKKLLVKLKDKGTKLKFDDDGVPHQIYELENEDDFQRRGPAALQRAQFVQEEAERVREADLDDKQLAKMKKREKREKRKAKEAGLETGEVDEDAPELIKADDGEDPLALLASLPLDKDFEDARPSKRPKKWFEDDSEDEWKTSERKGRAAKTADEPETLEDLEALAAELLD